MSSVLFSTALNGISLVWKSKALPGLLLNFSSSADGTLLSTWRQSSPDCFNSSRFKSQQQQQEQDNKDNCKNRNNVDVGPVLRKTFREKYWKNKEIFCRKSNYNKQL